MDGEEEDENAEGQNSEKIREISLGIKGKGGQKSSSSSSRLTISKILQDSIEASKLKAEQKEQRHQELMELKRQQIEADIELKRSQMITQSIEVLNIFKKESGGDSEDFSQPIGMAINLADSIDSIINSVRYEKNYLYY